MNGFIHLEIFICTYCFYCPLIYHNINSFNNKKKSCVNEGTNEYLIALLIIYQ